MASSDPAVSTGVDAESTEAISWVGPTYARSRSVAVGCLVALVAAIVVVLAVAAVAIVVTGALSAEMLVVGGVLLLVGGPASLAYVAIAYSEATERQKQSLWRVVIFPLSDHNSWLRGWWVGVGMLTTVGAGWWLSTTTFNIGVLAPTLIVVGSLAGMVGESSYRLDPGDEALEIMLSHGNHTSEHSLEWLVDFRRFDIGSTSLFVCSNRGKRWYDGVTFVVVPTSVADSVAAVFQRAAEAGASRRLSREDRIVFGVVGSSMVGVGPLLYLISGEAAMLFILGGLSTLIGFGAVFHAFRG